MHNGFFTHDLVQSDPELAGWIEKEATRQQQHIELIASENFVSHAVLQAQGSILTNKYAEGYPGKRYYGGCEYVDHIEQLAIDRAKQLYNCAYANVQPNSGSQANQAVFTALLKPGDTFLALGLDAGGHLTHGAKPNQSGKWFNAVHYGVNETSHLIEMDRVEALARLHQPKIIIAGGSAYPQQIDFEAFRKIADSVGAYLMVDMAHISGLVAGGGHPNPVDHAHVVTSTTHKTLRAGRGGMILSNDEALGKKFNSAIFPGIQGGPLVHAIAAKAAAFGEALRPEFKVYTKQVLKNATAMANAVRASGLDLVSHGTATHLALIDLRPKGVTGRDTEAALERAFITCNKNGVPFDSAKPTVTSGIRVGSPAGTTRGFGEEEFSQIGEWISEIVDVLSTGRDSTKIEDSIRGKVIALTDQFPIYAQAR